MEVGKVHENPLSCHRDLVPKRSNERKPINSQEVRKKLHTLQVKGRKKKKLRVPQDNKTFHSNRVLVEGGEWHMSMETRCRTVCGFESTGLFMFVLLVASTYITLYYFYRCRIKFKMSRCYVFLFLGCASLCLALSFVWRQIKMVKFDAKNLVKEKRRKKKKNIRQKNCLVNSARIFYNDFLHLNGKYYLVKMYLGEIAENGIQLYNLIDIYACTMRVGWSVMLSIVLILEIGYNMWAIDHMKSKIIRDRQLLVDIVTDTFSIAFPIFYVRMVLNVPIDINQMLQLTVVPTFFLLSKVDDIWSDITSVDADRVQETVRRTLSPDKNNSAERISCAVTREDVLQNKQHTSVIEQQVAHFPWQMRWVIKFVNALFILSFLSLEVMHFSLWPTDEVCAEQQTSEIWDQCDVVTPFCQKMFVAKCDCAVLELRNYSRSSLSRKFGELKSLIKFGVYEGSLESLPPSFGLDHKKIVTFQVVGNSRLTMLPSSIGEISSLLQLRVNRNNLTMLPQSIAKLNFLTSIHAQHNQLQDLPSNLPPQLKSFYLWNNRLKELPSNLGGLEELEKLDVRNNKLTALPHMGNLDDLTSFYIEGNPGLCNGTSVSVKLPLNLKEAEGLCETQCSTDCPSFRLTNTVCDDEKYYERRPIPEIDFGSWTLKKSLPVVETGCNTKSCDFDNGLCRNDAP